MTLAVEAEGVSMKSEDWFFCRKQTLISGGAVFILYKTIIIILCHQTNIQSQPWAYMFLLLIALPVFDFQYNFPVSSTRKSAVASAFKTVTGIAGATVDIKAVEPY